MTEHIAPMFDPPHPGEVLAETYLVPLGISARTLAAACGVAATSIARIIAGTARVTPEMAVRLEKVLGQSARSWMNMQDAYDLWRARQEVDVSTLDRLPALASVRS